MDVPTCINVAIFESPGTGASPGPGLATNCCHSSAKLGNKIICKLRPGSLLTSRNPEEVGADSNMRHNLTQRHMDGDRERCEL